LPERLPGGSTTTEAVGDETVGHINYERLYSYRHRRVNQAARESVWEQIGPFIYDAMGRPSRVLDPAAGRGEFINAIAADERWLVDAVDYPEARRDPSVRVIIGDARVFEFPDAYFGGIFVSNLLEHFSTQDQVADFLGRMRAATEPGGRIVVMGPNFRYCARNYFDCADHTLALTHVAVEEHLYAAGFEVLRVVPRFLPFSFNNHLPPSPWLTRLYLRVPLLWRVLGKQFLLIGQSPDETAPATRESPI
jgi:ubiquinone/menaquinone biosynthesis C-methylase UbiE